MLQYIANSIKTHIGKQVLNQEEMTEHALAAFFAGGHVLLSGPAGLGKTEWGRSLAKALGVSFNRVRFVEGIMPYDVLGVIDRKLGQGELRRGPLFTQVFMADGIGNAQPKIQSILMDAMEEQTATIEGEKYGLAEPFFLIGTHDGTRMLPEALMDRFMMKLYVSYPGVAAEKQILQSRNEETTQEPICSAEAIAAAKQEVHAVVVEDTVLNYIISIVETTRRVGAVQTGASIRGSIALLEVSKAYAAIQGRDFVVMDDVRVMALPVLRHRIILKQDAVQEGVQPDRIIETVLNNRRG